MDIIKEDGLNITVSLTLPFTELQKGIDKKILQLTKTASVAGFRKGKVPIDVIKQKYAKSLLGEVADDVMKDHFLQLAIDKNIKLAGVISMQPKQLDFDKDFTFEVNYEVYPSVEVTITPNTQLEKVSAKVTEDDINRTIEDMRSRTAKYEDALIGVEAKDEHIAIIDFDAETTDAEKKKFSSNDMSVDLSTQHPSANFVAQVKGMKDGEQKSFTDKVKLRVDDNKGEGSEASEEIQEREALFNVRLKKLQRKVLPEVNNDFFKKYGVEGDEKEFRSQVRKNMEFELNSAINRIKYHKLTAIILDNNKGLEVPSTQINREASRMRDEAIQRWSQLMGGQRAPEPDKLPLDLFKEKAAEKIKAGLFIGEFARKENLVPSEEQVNVSIKKLSETYENPKEVEKQYQQNDALKEQVRNKLLEDMAMDKFIGLLDVTEREVTYQEAMAISAKIT